MKEIDISEWVESGAGAIGKSYNHVRDTSLMLKLYDKGYKLDDVLAEHRGSEILAECGLPCPAPGEIVSSEGRTGLIYRRIPGKKSFARAIGENPDLIGDIARRFAAMTKKLQATKAPEGTISTTEFVKKIADGCELPGSIAERTERAFEALPESPNLIHGDLHYGNAITDGTNDYFIDLGNVSHGPASFDITMVLFSTLLIDSRVGDDMFHMPRSSRVLFWEAFKKEYYGSTAIPKAELAKIADVIPLRIVVFLRDMGHLPLIDIYSDAIAEWQKSLRDEYELCEITLKLAKERNVSFIL